MSGPPSEGLSRSLIPQPSNPPAYFQQAGQVSWTDLSRSTVSLSVDILTRLAAADIQPHTLMVGQAIARSFRLGREGQGRLDEAVKNMSSMKTVGNILHFGFGVDSVVRKLVDTDEGLVLVALCAAIVECYPDEVAPSILWELAQLHREPDRLTPSSNQWKSLIGVCAGVLMPTTFSLYAEHFMSLIPPADQPSPSEGRRRRDCSSPDTIAIALLSIGQVSMGKLMSVTIAGGSDAGWLAAVAEWFFNLRVVISDATGQQLYTNCRDIDLDQVHIYLGKSRKEGPSQEVEIRGKICHLQGLSELIGEASYPAASLVSGRVPWDSLFFYTFGSRFDLLMNMGSSFGYVLGCAARVFEAVVRVEEGFEDEAITWKSYFSSSYGKGLVASMNLTFPELHNLREQMDLGTNNSGKNAAREYHSGIATIRNLCGCDMCKNPESFTDSVCLVLITETILTVGRTLAGISGMKDICPKLSGIELQCGQLRNLRALATNSNKHTMLTRRKMEYGDIGFVLQHEASSGLYLQKAASIFAGYQSNSTIINKDLEPSVNAISVAGMTAYLDVLVELTDEPERAGRCHLVPGHINVDGRILPNITDLGCEKTKEFTYRWLKRYDNSLQTPTDLRDNYTGLSLTVSQSSNSVQVGFLAKDIDGGVTVIPPAKFINRFLMAFRRVRCDQQTHPTPSEALSGRLASSTVTRLTEPGPEEIWHFQGDLIARAVALTREHYFYTKHLLIRDGECLECCRQAASSGKARAMIVSQRLV